MNARMFLNAPTLLAAVDADLICRHASAGWLTRLGLTPGTEPLELPLDQLIAIGNPEVWVNRFRGLLNTGGSLHDVPVALHETTGPTQGLLSAWRVQPEEGAPGLILAATCNDELDEALDELRRLRTKHELILDAAGEGIYGLDEAGRTTFGNAATMRILGWSPTEILGQKAHEVHHVDDEVFWHSNGSAIPVEYTSTPIRQDGEVKGAVVVFRDISERRAIERQREAAYQEIKQLKEQLELERDYLRDEIDVATDFTEIIGISQALKRTLAQIEAVAATPASVMVLGESGVGKEMVARAIHARSGRAGKPLVKVNCASIPGDLFESEFFGHVKGAFTGAHRDRVGRLQLADGGTVFLDEVGEIPLSLQSKLLRALQENEFERVGDERTIRVDVRIIAATNRDLESEVRAGRFREDLYYRLSVFPIEVPPLRKRSEDIGPLAQHFLERSCTELGRDPLRLSKDQVLRLQTLRWPGNIRELKNVIERAVILSRSGRVRLDLAVPEDSAGTVTGPGESNTGADFVTDAEFREQEKANLTAALRHAQGRIWGSDGAAELLGLKPSTLAYRMKVLGIGKGG